MKQHFLMGMDGGGTATKVIIATMDGAAIKDFELGSLNINGQTRQMTENTLKECIKKVTEIGLDIEDCEGICVGAAGISNGEAITVITKSLRDSGVKGTIKIVGDHETALASAAKETWGAILIAGTGSICFGVTQAGQNYRAGGYGHIIDDAGSAYAIGRDILKWSVRGEDGRAPRTVLFQKVLEKLNLKTLKELISWLYQPERTKKEIAALAVLLEDGLKEGDEVSNFILQDCVRELVSLAKAVLIHLKEKEDLVVSGSVLLKNETIYHMFCKTIGDEYPNLNIIKMGESAAKGAVKIILKEIQNEKIFSH